MRGTVLASYRVRIFLEVEPRLTARGRARNCCNTRCGVASRSLPLQGSSPPTARCPLIGTAEADFALISKYTYTDRQVVSTRPAHLSSDRIVMDAD